MLFKYVPLSVLRALALFVAWIMNGLPNLAIKRIVDINLRLAYPNLSIMDRQRLRQAIIRNQALSSVESVKSWAMPPCWSIDQIHTVHNQNILVDAINNPKGMLAIVPHLGTWEMMNAWINQFGNPTIMFKPIKNKFANDFILQGRQRLNSHLVPTDSSGVKAVFRTLKQGGFSVVLPDHVPKDSGGINAPFFGVETLTSTLTPKLASKTKCALVGLICVRHQHNGAHSLIDADISNKISAEFSTDSKTTLEAPVINQNMQNDKTLINEAGRFDIYCIPLDDPNLYDKDIRIATIALNNALQTMINSHPSHYLWGYKRFKNIPVVKNPYKLNDTELEKFIKSLNE